MSRIAYMTGQYPTASDTFIQREVAQLRASGMTVRTFAVRRPFDWNDNAADPALETERGQTTYLLPCGIARMAGAHLSMLLRHPRNYARAMRLAHASRGPGVSALRQACYFAEAALVAERMRRERLSHIHNHFANSSCTVAMLAARMLGATFSFTIHGSAIFFEPHKWRIDVKAAHALFINCISRFCRAQTMLFAPRDAWGRMHIVHCGVDPTRYEPRTHHGEGNQVLFVGRLVKVKGLPLLLQAIARLRRQRPDVALTLIGDGPDRAELEAEAARLNIADNVTFTGNLPHEQVRDAMAQADVVALSSFAEGVPVVLMEAMASGVPVIAPRVGGVAELVDDGVSGLLFDPGDIDALAAHLNTLLNDAAMRERFGRAGRTKVEHAYDIRSEAQWQYRILSNALTGRATPCRDSGVAGIQPLTNATTS
jgi:glycosyltransferase involved in cell wall biosynthesis